MQMNVHFDDEFWVDEDVEQLTARMINDLRQLDIEDVRPNVNDARTITGANPKGDPGTLGTILITLAASGGVLSSVVNAIQSYLTRDKQSFTLEINGEKITITNPSSRERQVLIDAWIKRHSGNDCQGAS